jgi:hypothetical protein
MPQLRADARRIHAGNAAQIVINAANNASETVNAARDDCRDSTAKNTAPFAATPAAFPICTAVPYVPEAVPAAAGFTVERPAPESCANTTPRPQP